MPTEAESLCCHEIDKVLEKMEDHEGYVNCVTEIPDFSTVCTEREVLRWLDDFSTQGILKNLEQEQSCAILFCERRT